MLNVAVVAAAAGLAKVTVPGPLTLVQATVRLEPVGKPSSVAVYDDHGRLLRLVLASDDRYRLWVPLRDMSPQLVDAVLLHEDRWYWWHPGFNPYGLARGAFVTYVSHGRRQGGSTITMQLARLLWPLNTHSPWGKLKQMRTPLTAKDAEHTAPPKQGENTEAILREAGISDADIAAMRAEGAAR